MLQLLTKNLRQVGRGYTEMLKPAQKHIRSDLTSVTSRCKIRKRAEDGDWPRVMDLSRVCTAPAERYTKVALLDHWSRVEPVCITLYVNLEKRRTCTTHADALEFEDLTGTISQ